MNRTKYLCKICCVSFDLTNKYGHEIVPTNGVLGDGEFFAWCLLCLLLRAMSSLFPCLDDAGKDSCLSLYLFVFGLLPAPPGGGVQVTVACSSTIHRYHSGAVYAIIMA